MIQQSELPNNNTPRVPDQASTPEKARELLMKTVEEVNPSEISFTERAAMRTQCRKLSKFMKVVYSVWCCHASQEYAHSRMAHFYGSTRRSSFKSVSRTPVGMGVPRLERPQFAELWTSPRFVPFVYCVLVRPSTRFVNVWKYTDCLRSS